MSESRLCCLLMSHNCWQALVLSRCEGNYPDLTKLVLPSQIVSLHALGGPLKDCCAVSYGRMLYVYPLVASPGRPWQPKASWEAHKSAVTALHRSAFGAQLISGAADGTIHLCDRLSRLTTFFVTLVTHSDFAICTTAA